jgi:hypothetical protein
MDNKYFQYKCPPLMQDGRFITNYVKNSTFEQFIRNVNQIDSAQDYKHFLQQNGDTIINRERAYINSINTCPINGKCVPINDNNNVNNNNVIKNSCGCSQSNYQS